MFSFLRLQLPLRLHSPLPSLRLFSSAMTHPVVSSGAAQIPALVSQHTNIVSGKAPQPQKEKKSKIVLASQFPLEVRCHCTATTRFVTHIASHQLQPPPGFLDHRIKIFEALKAEYDAFVQGLPLRSSPQE